MKYALVLLLLSCGAPGHEYMRGTMVAPPPAPARPGVGAPIRGQPGEPRVYPRSPHTRVLPQTPETRHGPGIWAADVHRIPQPPVRKVGDPIPHIMVLEFEALVHPDANDGLDAMPTEQCAYTVEHDIYANQSLLRMAFEMTTAERECLAAAAMGRCLEWAGRMYGVMQGNDRMTWAIKKALEANDAWLRKACAKVKARPDLTRILDTLDNSRTTRPEWIH